MYSFIAFDVVEFYPSISLALLREALQFASDYDTITDNERHIILEAKSSLLYSYGEPWGKKTSSNLFDVTMGSYDGAESCELVGAYLLHKIKEKDGSISDFNLRSGVPFVFVGAGKERLIQLLDYSSAAP